MVLHDVMNSETLAKIGKMVIRPIDQSEKAEYYKKILKKLDFKELDMGTNRQIFVHKEYPKVVFKVALDEQGVSDNLNEYEKSPKHKAFPSSHDIDSDGYILVQTKKKTYDTAQFYSKPVQKAVRKLLEDLDKSGFVLVDLGIDKPKNYGYDKDGNVSVIDFGYVEYKSMANFNCPHQSLDRDYKRCKGTLEYNDTFTMMQCPKCKNVFQISVLMEGYNSDMYAVPQKTDYFELTPELADFYRSYKTTRTHTSTTEFNENMKQYVKISRDQPPKGDDEPVFVKDIWRKKLGGKSSDERVVTNPAPVSSTFEDWQKNRDEKDEDEQDTLPISSKEAQALRERSADILRQETNEDPDDEASAEEARLQEEEDRRMIENLRKLNNRPLAHVDNVDEQEEDNGNNIQLVESKPVAEVQTTTVTETTTISVPAPISFDWSKASDHINELSKTDALGLIQSIHAHFGGVAEHVTYTSTQPPSSGNNSTDEAQEAGLTIRLPSEFSNEIHIGMVVEDLKRSPIIVASANGIVFTIDLVQHLKRLVEYLPPDHMHDMIVTTMSALPISEFNKDYDGQYFETEID